MADTPDLVLHNANVITMNPQRPRARGVVCRNGRILAITDELDQGFLGSGEITVIDCQGQTVLPGFIDAHTHFLAYASSLIAVDCSPQAVGSIVEIAQALALRAEKTPPQGWIRGVGYNEFYLAEKRHPDRKDLDKGVPDHPVKLNHRSGHALVLNSRAMALAGIGIETPEPEFGFIDRDIETGEPTGLFVDLDAWLDGRLGPSPRADEMDKAVWLASERYLSMGITSFQDASPRNSLRRWDYFQRLKEQSGLCPRVTLMPGYQHIREFVDAGRGYGAGDDHLRIGHAKIVLSQASGTLTPSVLELNEIVREAASLGFPVAIHAVEELEVEAAIEALEPLGTSGLRHRIEHCSVCPPCLTKRLKELNATIVTQPGFIYYSGERYLHELPNDQLPNLYPVRSWLRSGLAVGGSSDAPVAPPDPLVGVQAAITRRAQTGQEASPEQALTTCEALGLYGPGAAWAAGLEDKFGKVKAGMLADLVVLDRDPTQISPEKIVDIQTWATIIGGKVVWRA